MFDTVVGSGGNAFLIIVACLVGFAAALSFIDFRRQKEKEGEGH